MHSITCSLCSRIRLAPVQPQPQLLHQQVHSRGQEAPQARRHPGQQSGHQANVSQLSSVQGRLLTQAELLKLGHFRRFLAGSGLGQLDFLYRVEQSRRQREDEASGEVDENGDTADNKG